MRQIKNRSLSVFKRGSLVFACLCFSICLKAQTDSTVTDSVTQIIDEGVKDETGDQTPGTGHQFFKDKSLADSLIVHQRNVPDGRIKELQKDKSFWYVDPDKKKKKRDDQNVHMSSYTPLGQQTWFQTLIWLVIIGGFAAALMWYLSSSSVGLFRKKNLANADTGEMEEMPENIFAINYQKEIDKAASQGNYRLAVRLMFLRLLKNLSERNIIQYKQDRTNFDYLMQLQPSNYYTGFFRLTRNYEYSWYGQFQVNEEAYKIIRNDFDQFERQLGTT